MPHSASMVWFRKDLRLSDNAALTATVATGGPVIPVYIWAPEEDGAWAPGGASRWWLHHSLQSLQSSLRRKGCRLIIRRGSSAAELAALARETGAGIVRCNRLYEPVAAARDRAVERALRAAGIELTFHNASLLIEPWDIANRSGKPFQVFTPFWRRCIELVAPEVPAPAPRRMKGPSETLRSLDVPDLGLLPKADWARGLRDSWKPGEGGAARQLERFAEELAGGYTTARDIPAEAGTSRLSPHLQFGEVGPRQVWYAMQSVRAAEPFLRQLGWREFAHHLLHHFPFTPKQPLRPEFKPFPWTRDARRLKAWQKGLTGYPIVDAGMRELWTTGWMHNRVRMIAASFLVKDLLIPWQTGAAWFWDTLVDADLANNTLGWQWTAGCGADAAPYFRIFNPTLQGRKFDPAGRYVRRWVPELAGLPDRWVHSPSDAPADVLKSAGIRIGGTYPKPVVNHAEARDRALEAYAFMRGHPTQRSAR